MATPTPHLSGIAALLKSSHPDRSPAAIKSAIMTAANLTNLGGTPITDDSFGPVDVFAIGSGHVNPTKADDPGLVYDIQPDDYISYLCGLGYSNTETYTRTATNVGPFNSSYIAGIIAPQGVDVKVTPNAIPFGGGDPKATSSVTFYSNCQMNLPFSQGYLIWVSADHVVRNPIAVTFE
uniref:Peptidase S8/S53 domain-containing protein n=1 Tax=Populus alba TaxID=43335 RepID=A0A4U5P6E3_POPAL|nr:hypothetical protein D5086_0000225950 [Populus alba]